MIDRATSSSHSSRQRRVKTAQTFCLKKSKQKSRQDGRSESSQFLEHSAMLEVPSELDCDSDADNTHISVPRRGMAAGHANVHTSARI